MNDLFFWFLFDAVHLVQMSRIKLFSFPKLIHETQKKYLEKLVNRRGNAVKNLWKRKGKGRNNQNNEKKTEQRESKIEWFSFCHLLWLSFVSAVGVFFFLLFYYIRNNNIPWSPWDLYGFFFFCFISFFLHLLNEIKSSLNTH